LLYPRAWKHLLTGIYLAEICMLGLFGLQNAFGPLLLMIVLLIVTILVHMSLNDAMGPLMYALPKTLCLDMTEPIIGPEVDPANSTTNANNGNVSAINLPKPDEDDDEDGLYGTDADLLHGAQSARAIEGAEGTVDFVSKSLKTITLAKIAKQTLPLTTLIHKYDFWTAYISPDPTTDPKPNLFVKWLHPEIFADYNVLRGLINVQLPEDVFEAEFTRDAYFAPSMVRPTPTLWIPRDVGGVSAQEVAHTRRVNPVTDEGAWLDERSRVVIDLDATAPIVIERYRR
jgi:hypothetical protein